MGRILKIEGKILTIQGGELGGCFGCMNEECRTNGKTYTAENRKDLELSVGNLVEINVDAGATASNAALVLLPPLVMFALAFVLASVLFPSSGEALHATLGVVGLALGFLGVYWFRKFRPAKSVPYVTRPVSEAESVSDD
ncbi:MAG: SoxR reducing system RseC family protein [Treponemataceae bacterium]